MHSGQVNPWALSLIMVGFFLFLMAKVLVIRSGKLVSFGAPLTSGVSWRISVPYVSGYLLMISGFILTFQ